MCGDPLAGELFLEDAVSALAPDTFWVLASLAGFD